MAFRAAGTAASGTGTSLTPGTPAGAAANDILILVASFDTTSTTITWPSGFTQLYKSTLTLDGQIVAVAWKRAVGSDSLATTKTGNNQGSWVVRCFAWSGRHTTNPPVGSTAATNNTSNASPTTVTATTVTAIANDDLVWIGGLDVTAATTSSTLTPPTGYTSQSATIDGVDHLDVFGIATKDAVSAGATGSVAGTLTHSGGSGWAAFLIRIPASAAGGGSQSISASITSSAAIAKVSSFKKAVVASITASAAIIKHMAASIAATAIASAAIAKAATILKSVAASVTSTANVARGLVKLLSLQASVTCSAALTTAITTLHSIAASVTTSATTVGHYIQYAGQTFICELREAMRRLGVGI